MIHPRIDELLDNVDSRYALVIVAAKRARQINDYHHQLGEGIGFEQAPPPLVESRSKNHLTRADLLVVAPLTANTLARLAHGLADNLVTEAALAHRGPVLLAPAMNPRMWAHLATQANVETVRARGAVLIGPDEGETAEGEWGPGRMAEPGEIYRRARELLGESNSLVGRRVLVSAGGTREPLDAVRFLGNRSSGRMGVALAAEAKRRGASVTLLAANLAVPPPPGVEVIETPTAEAMLDAALARHDADLVLMAAAVADYRP